MDLLGGKGWDFKVQGQGYTQRLQHPQTPSTKARKTEERLPRRQQTRTMGDLLSIDP